MHNRRIAPAGGRIPELCMSDYEGPAGPRGGRAGRGYLVDGRTGWGFRARIEGVRVGSDGQPVRRATQLWTASTLSPDGMADVGETRPSSRSWARSTRCRPVTPSGPATAPPAV